MVDDESFIHHRTLTLKQTPGELEIEAQKIIEEIQGITLCGKWDLIA